MSSYPRFLPASILLPGTQVLPIPYPYPTHILPKVYPRCTQGLPKVYPRSTQGVPKSKRLAYTWVVLEYYLGRVWVERRNEYVYKLET